MVRNLVVPNLKSFGDFVLQDALATADEKKKAEGEMMVTAILNALISATEKEKDKHKTKKNKNNNTTTSASADDSTTVNGGGTTELGFANGHATEMKDSLAEKVGGVLAEKIIQSGDVDVAKVVLD